VLSICPVLDDDDDDEEKLLRDHRQQILRHTVVHIWPALPDPVRPDYSISRVRRPPTSSAHYNRINRQLATPQAQISSSRSADGSPDGQSMSI